MFPASQFSCTYGGWLCFLGRPACPAPNCRNRGLRGMRGGALFRASGLPRRSPPRRPCSSPKHQFRHPVSASAGPGHPVSASAGPGQAAAAGPAFPPPPQNACRARGPARPAAARIGRERRHQRAIAEFAAAHPKLPAGLCAPATGGRRLPPCALERGEGQRTGSCPPPLPPPRASPAPLPQPVPRGMLQGTLRQAPRARGPPGRRRRFPAAPSRPVGAWC